MLPERIRRAMLKTAIESITKDSSFHLPVEPAASSLRIAYNLLEKYDQSKSVFDSLERKVLQKLQACFSTSKKEVSFQTQKAKLCREYHTIRTAAEFHTLWKNFFDHVGVENPGPTFYQEVADLLYEQMIKESFPVHHVDSGLVDQPVTYVDANVVWYTAGYVCRKIKEKLHKKTPPNQQMINCIDSLIEGSREEYNEVSLSAEWIEMIDRGGLCHVKDGTFYLFNAMEEEMREHFRLSRVHQMGEGYKDSVISSIIENEEVQFHWSVLTSDITTEEANEVLQMITKLWTTIRGFSFASDWIELYKQNKKQSIQKSKPLRKGIN